MGTISETAFKTILAMVLWCVPLLAQSLDKAKDHSHAGVLLANQGKWLEAESEFRAATKDAPSVATFHAQLGSMLGVQGKWEEALRCYQQAISLDPQNTSFQRDAAGIQWQLGQTDSAIAELQTVLKASPDDGSAAVLLAMIFESKKEYLRAVPLFKAHPVLAMDHSDRAISYFRAAVKSNDQESVSTLIQILCDPVKNGPWQDTLEKAIPFSVENARPDIAEELLPGLHKSEAITLSAHSFVAGGWVVRGTRQLKLGALQDAEVSFRHAKTLDANLPEASLGTASVMQLSGNSQGAILEYRTGINRFPQDPRFRVALAKLLLGLPQASINQSQAEILLKEAIAIAPDFAEGHFQLGRLYFRSGEMEKAELELRKASNLEPSLSGPHFILATILRRKGQAEEAAKEQSTYDDLRKAEEAASQSEPNSN